MKKSYLQYIAVVIGLLALFSCTGSPVQESDSQVTYNYAKLKLLDLDQMSDLIQNRIERYKKTNNEELMAEALEICLSRPDEDSVVEKLIENIRFSLDTDEQWEQIVESVVDKSIAQLKNETTAGVDQVTYLILLENLISQFRPEFIKQYQSPMFESDIIEKIAAADILVSETADNERRLNLMTTQKSPSAAAADLIKARDKSSKTE